jgi:hypothetical protein
VFTPSTTLQTIRLFLEDAEPWATRYQRNPHVFEGADLHQVTQKMTADVINALAILREMQPGARGGPWGVEAGSPSATTAP